MWWMLCGRLCVLLILIINFNGFGWLCVVFVLVCVWFLLMLCVMMCLMVLYWILCDGVDDGVVLMLDIVCGDVR